MYGFVNHVIELLVQRKFGDAAWMEIKNLAGVAADREFAIFETCDDAVTYDLVGAAAKLLNVPAKTVLEIFGAFFYEYCVEAGYDGILRALGATPVEFLQNLDALHDHLGSAYMGMRAPSFRCTTEDDEDGTRFYLHYYSHRPGLSPVVVGLVKAAIAGIFNIQVDITEDLKTDDQEQGGVRFLVTIAGTETDPTKRLGSTHSLNTSQGAKELLIKTNTFEQLFPFYLVFDRQLKVVQVGKTLARIFPGILTDDVPVDQILEFIRPKMPFTFASILGHINTVYVLIETASSCATRNVKLPFKLKGQMTFQWQYNVMLFLGSPTATDLHNLCEQQLFFSDLPLHDATRDLLLMAEVYSEEFEIAADLEVMTNALQITYRQLDEEKQKTDRLVYSVIPPLIVDDLRHGRKIAGRRFENVTLMFSGIGEFAAFCTTHDPIDVVNLLNACYTVFDNILDPKIHSDVYKVETIADHYMVVSGCPQETESHARAIAGVALALLASSSAINMEGKNVQITFGIHSGEIMAGVIGDRMPRYCLFGDCVNTTSRTEAFGKKGSINLTGITYHLLQTPENQNVNFKYTFYDNVAMKGKPHPVPVWLLSDCEDTVEVELTERATTLNKNGQEGQVPTPIRGSLTINKQQLGSVSEKQQMIATTPAADQSGQASKSQPNKKLICSHLCTVL